MDLNGYRFVSTWILDAPPDVVYQALREEFMRELPPLPDMDLETFAAQEGALPLEAFIERFEKPASVDLKHL